MNIIWKRIVALMLSFALVWTSILVPQTDVNAASVKKVKSYHLKNGKH